jgi:hypothetical protein
MANPSNLRQNTIHEKTQRQSDGFTLKVNGTAVIENTY